jgi:hypothetical protein
MIPFTNSEELSQKINQFLGQPLTNALSITPSAQTKIAPPTISAPTQKTTASTTTHSPQPFRIETENHWLWTEYKVIADLDLRNPLHASGSEAFLSILNLP